MPPEETAAPFSALEVETLQDAFLVRRDDSIDWRRVTGWHATPGDAERLLEVTRLSSNRRRLPASRTLIGREELEADWLILKGEGHEAAAYLWRVRENWAIPRFLWRRTGSPVLRSVAGRKTPERQPSARPGGSTGQAV